MSFKDLISRLRPANKNLNFMEVKEMSERVEQSEILAKEAIKIHLYEKKVWRKACKKYAAQCKNPKR